MGMAEFYDEHDYRLPPYYSHTNYEIDANLMLDCLDSVQYGPAMANYYSVHLVYLIAMNEIETYQSHLQLQHRLAIDFRVVDLLRQMLHVQSIDSYLYYDLM